MNKRICISLISIFTFLGCIFFNSSISASIISLFPNDYVEKLISGYSTEEIDLIDADYDNIEKLVFRKLTAQRERQPIYIATAGGPGSNKSTLIEKYRLSQKNFAYLDPDQRVLKLMINTYLQEMSNDKISQNTIKTRGDWENHLYKSYTKWRNASNYIVSMLLNEAYNKGYNIIHGTTSTSPQVAELYKKLKEKNYKIVLLLCYSSDENRIAALKHRSDVLGFYRLVPEEIVSKGKLFPERFPVYFQYADEIQLYWIEDFLKGEILSATLKKGAKKIIIHNEQAMKKFAQKYEADRKDKNLNSLDELIEKYLQ